MNTRCDARAMCGHDLRMVRWTPADMARADALVVEHGGILSNYIGSLGADLGVEWLGMDGRHIVLTGRDVPTLLCSSNSVRISFRPSASRSQMSRLSLSIPFRCSHFRPSRPLSLEWATNPLISFEHIPMDLVFCLSQIPPILEFLLILELKATNQTLSLRCGAPTDAAGSTYGNTSYTGGK